MNLPKSIKQLKLLEEYGKAAVLETFADAGGRTTDWLIFACKRIPVIVLPITHDDRVIAIRQFRHGANELVLELPGGLNDENTRPIDTAYNELLEETGYMAEGGVVELPGPVHFDPCSFRVQFLSYLARDCRVSEGWANGEGIKVELYDVADWYAKLASGQVVDAKSFVTSILALPHLGNGLTGQKAQAMKGLFG